MNLNWNGLDQWQLWALGIGCSLVAAFVIALWRKFITNRNERASREAVQQTAAPSLRKISSRQSTLMSLPRIPGCAQPENTDTKAQKLPRAGRFATLVGWLMFQSCAARAGGIDLRLERTSLSSTGRRTK